MSQADLNNALQIIATEYLPVEDGEEKKEATEEWLAPLPTRKQVSFFDEESKEPHHNDVQYAKVGLDENTIIKFKQLAASLVVEKEAEIARNFYLGSEKDVNMEESIECVPKKLLNELEGQKTRHHRVESFFDTISVGELLSLLEV